MASTMTGIQISSHRLTIAAVRSGNVIAQATARIPRGLVNEGRVTDLTAMAELIRDTLATRGIRSRSCALVLPKALVLTRQLTLPVMGPAELKLNLPYEFRDRTTRPLSDYDFDYTVLSATEEHLELFAAAVLREGAEEYRRLLKLAGLRLEIALPAEQAWRNYLVARPELPDPVGILQQDRDALRLDIFSGGRFLTGKELPKSDAPLGEPEARALHRTLNLYNFSLSPDARPVENLMAPEDISDPERELLARITGMNLHPGTLLPGGAAAGAALQPSAPESRNSSTVRKQTLNLIRPVKSFNTRKMLPLVGVLTAALLAFAKFGILDPLEEKALAYNTLSARQAQLEQANQRLGEYDAIFRDHIRFGDSQMRPAETGLVSRSQILSLADSTIAPLAQIDSLTVNGNVLTVNLSGITLEAAGTLVTRLEDQAQVTQAGILSATAGDGNEANILLTVTLEKEEIHE